MKDDLAEDQPSFFSWEWWKHFFSAMKVWQYTPKQWGVYHFSSALTWCLSLGIMAAVKALFPSFTWSAIKSFFGKILIMIGAIIEFCLPG